MSNREEKLDANLTDVPASEEDFSLEEILAEYGGSLEQVLLREMEDALPPEPAPESPPRPEPEAQREPEKWKRPAGRKTGASASWRCCRIPASAICLPRCLIEPALFRK